MNLLNSFKTRIDKVNFQTFPSLALEIFQFQAQHCSVYRSYINNLGINPVKINNLEQIPFLPIDMFKYHDVKTGDWSPVEHFLSSGTTAAMRSTHWIEDTGYYLHHSRSIFELLYRPIDENIFFALLPSYQEQGNSSLVRMVDHFMTVSNSKASGGFYLERLEDLITDLQTQLKMSSGKSIILFGVGYALLDLSDRVEQLGMKLDGLTIIETGGMKGRRKDMLKDEFYRLMKDKMGDVEILSEYGMTELLSQAYSFDERLYTTPPQMKIVIRDAEDPFFHLPVGLAGGINVIDLANIHSCAFIETRDLGKLSSHGKFEILGRLDNSDIRGCNLMIV